MKSFMGYDSKIYVAWKLDESSDWDRREVIGEQRTLEDLDKGLKNRKIRILEILPGVLHDWGMRDIKAYRLEKEILDSQGNVVSTQKGLEFNSITHSPYSIDFYMAP